MLLGTTNFTPYAKFLTAMGIPFSVVTDWDPRAKGGALGFNRSWKLVDTIVTAQTGESPTELIKELKAIKDGNKFASRCEAYGVFSNMDTLEVDMFNDTNFTQAVIDTLRETSWSEERKGWIDGWEADPEMLDIDNYLKLIEAVGKGRFAQRLASRIDGMEPPAYIDNAIGFVAQRV